MPKPRFGQLLMQKVLTERKKMNDVS